MVRVGCFDNILHFILLTFLNEVLHFILKTKGKLFDKGMNGTMHVDAWTILLPFKLFFNYLVLFKVNFG
jgi:hypothetical protein